MLEELKRAVFEANLALVRHGLVLFTWGNVSAIDRKSGLVVIKPSGVAYGEMTAADMVAVDLNGARADGGLNPSSDTPTHIELYKAFPTIGGVVHTHSTFATAFAQSGTAIECYGTTHADYFRGAIPCTRALLKREIAADYEKNTGLAIAAAFKGGDHTSCPAALVKSHGPFVWGASAAAAVHNAVVLEEIAKTAYLTRTLNPSAEPVARELQDKHYLRKHGADASYGQK